jgi:hypothetical protein
MKKLSTLVILFAVLFSCNNSGPIDIELSGHYLYTFYNKNESSTHLSNFEPTGDFFGEGYTLIENNELIFTDTDYLHSCSITKYGDDYGSFRYVVHVKYNNGKEYITDKYAKEITVDKNGELSMLRVDWVHQQKKRKSFPKVVTEDKQNCFWSYYSINLDNKYFKNFRMSGGAYNTKDNCAG